MAAVRFETQQRGDEITSTWLRLHLSLAKTFEMPANEQQRMRRKGEMCRKGHLILNCYDIWPGDWRWMHNALKCARKKIILKDEAYTHTRKNRRQKTKKKTRRIIQKYAAVNLVVLLLLLRTSRATLTFLSAVAKVPIRLPHSFFSFRVHFPFDSGNGKGARRDGVVCVIWMAHLHLYCVAVRCRWSRIKFKSKKWTWAMSHEQYDACEKNSEANSLRRASLHSSRLPSAKENPATNRPYELNSHLTDFTVFLSHKFISFGGLIYLIAARNHFFTSRRYGWTSTLMLLIWKLESLCHFAIEW